MPPLWQPKNHHKLPSQSWFLWNIKPLWTSWYIQPQQYFFLPHTNLHSQIQTTTFFIQSDCEDVWIKIDLFGSKSLIIGAYYKPHEHDQQCWEEFSKSLSKTRKLNCNIWVAGDFNLLKMDWDHMCHSPVCKHPSFYRHITEVLNDSNLTQTACFPANSWFQYSWSLLYNKSDSCATS